MFLRFRNPENVSAKWYAKIDQGVLQKRIQEQGKILSSMPHRAGTSANRKVGDEILNRLSQAGLKTFTEEYTFDFPEPAEAHLLLVQPQQIKFDLHEKKLSDDPWSEASLRELPFLAFSPDADIEAKLVYANSGSEEDYAFLKSQGIQVAGTIALVRARGICRSMKILAAEKEGIAGLLIYPELKDQGFLKTRVSIWSTFKSMGCTAWHTTEVFFVSGRSIGFRSASSFNSPTGSCASDLATNCICSIQ